MLSALDWVILGVVAFSAVISIMRGFVKEAASICSWIAAFTVSGKFYPQLEGYLTFSSDPLTRMVIAIIILFIGTLLITGYVGNTICLMVKKAGLSGFDRMLGIAFGTVRGVLVVSAVLALAQILFSLHILSFVQNYAWYQQSMLVPELQRIVSWFFLYMGTMPATGV